MTVRTMSTSQQQRFIKHMEKQGCEVRKTKSGYIVKFPDGGTESVHISYGSVFSLRNDITRFRKHGVTHPEDKDKPKKMTENNDAPAPADGNEYPEYMTGPINSTTRKRVLAELESRGWPLRIKPQELTMDTVTAHRALYAVGYRWDTSTPRRNRIWDAPDDIRELHEKVKAEMARREEEARERARAAHVPTPADVAKSGHQPPVTIRSLEDARAAREEGRPLPSLDFAKRAGHDGPHLPHRMTQTTPPITSVPGVQKPKVEEREFIDSVDSWVVTGGMPNEVMGYLNMLRGAGLEVEIRVWKKGS
jgi:hypothetical protein